MAALASACREQDTPVAPVARPSLALSQQPLESLGELPPFIEIARQVPTFGGFWFNERDEVVVGLTDLADFQRVVALIPGYLGAHRPSGYVGMKVARSFADLARSRAALRDQVFRQAGVVSLGVKESANRVEVGVSDPAVESTVRGLARTLGIPDDVVAIKQVAKPRPASHTLQDRHPSSAIEGGWEIADTAGHTCSLGFPAIRGSTGSFGFVTASHCTPTVHGFDGGRITQDAGGGTVGWEILDPPAWACGGDQCRNADAAFISAVAPVQFARIARPIDRVGLDQTGGSIAIDHSNPTITISGRLSFVWENEVLDKVGRTTGWTYGAVEDTCTDYNSGIKGEPKWKKLCSDRVDFAIDAGDSGSPVFYWKADGTAELRGVVFGENNFCTIICYNDAMISNLHQVELDLGPLSVHGVIARIDGPSIVLPSQNYAWNAIVTGGKAPFTFSWRRNGAVVSTSATYTGNSGSSDFELRLNVSDALSGGSADTLLVQVWTNPCPPPEIVCD